MPIGVYMRTKEMNKTNSESKKGNKNPMYGRKISEEYGWKISKSNKGKHNYWQGKHHSKESNIKRSQSEKITNAKPEIHKKRSEARIKQMEQQLLNGTTKWMNTDIEILMYEGLLSEGYIVAKQYFIKNVGFVDFYLPEENIVIECDGDYWHNLPEQKTKDEYRNRKLKELGYKVIRFKGSEIKKNLKICLKQIEEEIK